MRIQHNIMAMSAYRNYNTNTSALAKNLEKLSSGYKINRAGDDAAGLAISEKMRAQITGLNAAQKNVKDGISLVKTAEGAMQEIQDMLNRMDYLATQSANGTYDDTVDRKALQKEVDSLKEEINRIAQSANFNGTKLLDGSLDANNAAAAALKKFQDVTMTQDYDHELVAESASGEFSIDFGELEFSFKATTTGAQTVNATIQGQTFELTIDGTTGKVTGITYAASAATQIQLHGATFSFDIQGTKITLTQDEGSKLTSDWNTALSKITFAVTGTYLDDNNNAYTLEWTVDQQPVYGEMAKQAQAHFSLTADMIKDGGQLKIGRDTYTFALGSDSDYASGTNVIQIKDEWLDADGNFDMKYVKHVAALLSQQSNQDFNITADANTGTVWLTEKVGSKIGDDYDLAGTSASTTNATWKDKTTKKSLVTFNPTAGSDSGDANTLNLQIGDTSDSYNQMKINIGDMHTTAMGTDDDNTIDGISIETSADAQKAVDVIRNAINYVSGIRGDLGAYQNRLEHTANNLSVMAENIQDAESTIRDTDIAEEMMSYTKNNILVQSAQAMLAQANAVPQGVLQLLG